MVSVVYEPIISFGLRTRHLSDRLLLLRHSVDHNYKFSRYKEPNLQDVCTYRCNGCDLAKYGDRKAAKKAERDEVKVNEGPVKYLKVVGQEIVDEVGSHHQGCRPSTDMEMAVEQLKRKEHEMVQSEITNPWNVNVQVM